MCFVFVVLPVKMRFLISSRYQRWSTYLPFFFYALFILIILNMSFPLKSSRRDSHHTQNHYDDFGNGLLVGPHNGYHDNGGGMGGDVMDHRGMDRESHAAVEYKEKLKRNRNELLEKKEIETVILSNPNTEASTMLKMAFIKADLNKDSTLSIQELAKYINAKVRDHIDNAIRSNPIAFAKIDNAPKDGLISWEEYHAFFLHERGLTEGYIRDHDENKHETLDRKTKEVLMKDKALWADAARSDPFSLTLDEFLAFRHPESSAANLLNLVDDLLSQFDDDGDDHLTIEEFSKIANDDLDEGRKLIISKNIEERKLEFIKLIDRNNDNKADRTELLMYIDPRHPRHALQEAAGLFTLSDTNKDMKLTLDEILVHAKLFLQSKVIDASESFHDEFR